MEKIASERHVTKPGGKGKLKAIVSSQRLRCS